MIKLTHNQLTIKLTHGQVRTLLIAEKTFILGGWVGRGGGGTASLVVCILG